MDEGGNIIYDQSFNLNEWFVIGLIVIGVAALLIVPRRMTWMEVLFNLSFGVTVGLMFDHTLAVEPFDFYDVGDQSKYQYFDIFSYIMYAPFGYFFIYGYQYLRIRSFGIFPYILSWTAFAVVVEWVGVEIVGLFHYKHGYIILYSIPIYLFVQSFHIWLYRLLFPAAALKAELKNDMSSR